MVSECLLKAKTISLLVHGSQLPIWLVFLSSLFTFVSTSTTPPQVVPKYTAHVLEIRLIHLNALG
jgi:hypothetical protein